MAQGGPSGLVGTAGGQAGTAGGGKPAMNTQGPAGAPIATSRGGAKPQPGIAQLPTGMAPRVAASGLASQWGRGPTLGGGKSGLDKAFNLGRINTDIASGGVTKVPGLL